MELLVGLVVIVAVGLMLFGVLGFLGLAHIGSSEAKDRERAPQTLDALFNGEPRATYRGTLPFETVIASAEDRGYTLTHQTDERGVKVLMFKLDDPSRVPENTPPSGHGAVVESVDRTPRAMVILGGTLVLLGALSIILGQALLMFLGFVGIVAGGTLCVIGLNDRSKSRRGTTA